MLWGVVVTGIIAFFLNSYYTGKKLNYSSWMQVKDISGSFIISFIIAIVVYFIKYLPFTYWIVLPVQIVIAGLMLIVICEVRRKEEYLELKAILCDYLKNIKN